MNSYFFSLCHPVIVRLFAVSLVDISVFLHAFCVMVSLYLVNKISCISSLLAVCIYVVFIHMYLGIF